MPFHDARVRVRYAETDQMGVVYYANYLVWMEVGRVEYCRSVGFNYQQMEVDDDVFLAVAEANCRYLAPAKFDDEVIVRTSVKDAHSRMIVFEYQMLRDTTTLAKGYTKHIWLNSALRPVRLPAKYRAAFGIATE
jgi:acyl-CoA thioester hydrolase